MRGSTYATAFLYRYTLSERPGDARGGTPSSKEAQKSGASRGRWNVTGVGYHEIVVVAEQLDELIGFTSGRNNISNDLE